MSAYQQRRALDIVQAVGALHFAGNVTPHLWYRTLRATNNKPDPDGKAHLVAITILGEIVYWYRPRIELDHQTGQIVSIHKRFPGDKLRRSIPSFMAKFGLTDRQVRDALDFLAKEVGVITKELRTVGEGDERRGNVLFLEIVPDVLRQITLPETIAEAPPTQRGTLALHEPNGTTTRHSRQRPVDEHETPSDLEVGGFDVEVGGSDLEVGGSDVEVGGFTRGGRRLRPPGRIIKINDEINQETTDEIDQTTNDESHAHQTRVVVAALQALGLSRVQASSAVRTHQLTPADVELWASWLATLRGVKNPVAVFAATIKQQPRPPQLPAAAIARDDDISKYISGPLSSLVKS